jgi:hypothetical protein
MLQVDSPDPIAVRPKKRNEMMTDESACTGNQDPNHITQFSLLRIHNNAQSISSSSRATPHAGHILR